MANSIHYNGTDLSTYNLTLRTGPEIWSPEPIYNMRKIPKSDRSVARETEYTPKYFNCDCIVRSASVSGLVSDLDNIAKTLGTRDDDELWFDSLNDRYWLARVSSSIDVQRYGKVALLSVQFVAPDPLAYKRSGQSSESVTYPSEDAVTPTLAGSAISWPTVKFIADSSVSTVFVDHSDINRSMSVSKNLASGARIKFDCLNWRAYYAPDDNEEWEDVTNKFSGQFIYLTTGENNVRLLAPGSGTLTVYWYDRYL